MERPISNKLRIQLPFLFLIVAVLCAAVITSRASMAESNQQVKRRVNMPYLGAGPETVEFFEPAIFWFGQVTPAINNADVRMWYYDDYMKVTVHVIDRYLWYDESRSPTDLEAWDAATLYLNKDGVTGSAPSSNTYRLVAQLNRWQPDERYLASYRGNGTAWVESPVSYTAETVYRGSGTNNNDSNDKGWQVTYVIPFSSLGLSERPAEGVEWGLSVAVHDRDEADGNPAIADLIWPELADANVPTTWGELKFGIPVYNVPAGAPQGEVVIREGLDGAHVADGHVGGHTTCGNGLDHWTDWGEANYDGYTQINIQNQWDVSDYPCFSKYFVTFPLDAVPAGKTILDASLTMYMFGNAGGGDYGMPPDSFIQVLSVAEDWDEQTLNWNNAPRALENYGGTWVEPGQVAGPRKYNWDVSRALANAYQNGEPLRLALYSADGEQHSGKYFRASEGGVENSPTLRVTWGDDCADCATNTPAPPTNTPVTPANTPVPPTNTPESSSADDVIYVSSSTGGNVGGVVFTDEDILKYDRASSTWSLFFDGSDVGLSGSGYRDIDAFHIMEDGSILLSIDGDSTVADVGTVDDSDIMRFVPTSLGSNTAGSMSLYLDGSDVGLTSSGEDIDALAVLPDGDLVVSAAGSGSVAGLQFKDEDLVRFSPSSLGVNTAGTWSIFFDGSDVELDTASGEDIWAVSAGGADGDVFLSTKGTFSVSGANGDGADVLQCKSASLGDSTGCIFQLLWDGSADGFAGEVVDGITYLPLVGGQPGTSTPVPPTSTPVPPTNTPVPGNDDEVVYVSFSLDKGNVGGVEFDDEDILKYDFSSSTWSMVFDASDVGLVSASKKDVIAFSILDDGSIVFSIAADETLPDVGAIDNSDIIRFVPTSLGSFTAGSFELYFDGSDVGLVTAGDSIDALTVLAGGDLLLSVTGYSDAGGFRSRDADLLRFSPTSLGANTAGSWSLYFDGSATDLSNSSDEDLWGTWVDDDSGAIYLTTKGVFSVPGVEGNGADIIECQPSSLGEDNTNCSFAMAWDGSAYGTGDEVVDGFAMSGVVIGGSPPPTSTPGSPGDPTATPVNTPVATPPGSNREFFMSPTGNDNAGGTSPSQAWATFGHAWSILQAGDTLTLLDGVYNDGMVISRSGQPNNPITVRAQNDGKAIIDGQYERYPIKTKSGDSVDYYVEVEGIVARNSVRHAIHLAGNHVTLRRVSAYNAHTDENAQVIAISGNHNLVEDCIASGTGRKMMAIFDGQYNTIRRCFADWREWDGRNWCGSQWPWGEGLEFYNADNNIIENSIGYGHTPRAAVSILAQGSGEIGTANNNKVLGTMAIRSGMKENGTPMVWGDTRPQPTDCTTVQNFDEWGSMLSGFRIGGSGAVHNNLIQDVLAWGGARYGLTAHQSGKNPSFSNNRVNRATIFNNGLAEYDPRRGGYGGDAAQEELVRFASIENSYIENIWTGGSTFVTQEGEGARLTHRYVDGVLTNEPLWPWPMQDRIESELGISVAEIISEIPNFP